MTKMAMERAKEFEMSVNEIVEFLDVSGATFDKWRADGVVKSAGNGQNKHNLTSVVRSVLRWRLSEYKKEMGKRVDANRKLKKAEQRIAVLEDRLKHAPKNPYAPPPDIDPSEMQEVDIRFATKEQLDAMLLRKRIEKMEMDASIRKKENIPSALLTEVVAELATDVSNTLDPILPQIKRSVPELPASVYDKIARSLAKLRNRLADYQTGKEQERKVDDFEPKGYVADDD